MINYDIDEDRYYESDYYNMPKLHEAVGDNVFNHKDLGNLIFKMNTSTCSKFYNREFVIGTGARFRENSKFNDNQFFWGVIFCAERIYFLDEFFYTRTRHSKSLTGSNDLSHSDIIGVYNDIIALVEKRENRVLRALVGAGLKKLVDFLSERIERRAVHRAGDIPAARQ